MLEYYDLLARIHRFLVPRTYVEVGVRNGQSLALACEETACVGIDPAMSITFPLPPATTLFHQTSDDFFATHDLRSVLGGLPVDLAFIDGMHHFEFALRDFVNLERSGERGSVVLVHDCLPLDRQTSTRERTTDVWSGDVWKLVVCLRRYRPDLQVATLDVPPTGMGVVMNLDPRSSALADRFDSLVEEFVPLAYDDVLEPDKAGPLNQVSHDWASVERLLASRPTGQRGDRAVARTWSLSRSFATTLRSSRFRRSRR
ncbi:MAG TPA: class I SAM-dependent methyltransferase [Acidimicrobiales bacterium]|nr:class I SAM-dependent methyltransferase [Acidimicrobiales bacterium]